MNFISIKNSDAKIIVDDEDFERVSKYNWHLMSNKRAIRSTSELIKHQTIAKFVLNYNGILEVDHINRIIFDNQKSNLRLATKHQNSFNKRKINLETYSKYKGVTWNRRMKMWQAQIGFNKKIFYLGCFKDEIDAARVYNKKALEFFKEFAVLNLI